MKVIAETSKIWAYQDLFDLPDGKRYEIIEGQLYEMPAPGSDHATVIVNLILLLGPVVNALGGRLFTAPVDVFLDRADPVQPDFVILLSARRRLISKRGVEGAPDLVIEVLSPSNPGHDRLRKRELYARSRVPEYWLASPEAATIEVLALDGNGFRTLVRAGGEEPIQSIVLSALAFPVSAAFAGTGEPEFPGTL